MVKRLWFSCVAGLAVFSFAGAAMEESHELSLARCALRDGFLSLAREVAAKVSGEQAQLIQLESLAREEKWADVLSLVLKVQPLTDSLALYGLCAVLHLPEETAQGEQFFSYDWKDADAKKCAQLLILQRALAGGDSAAIEKARNDAKENSSSPEGALLLAEAAKRLNEKSEAEALWREIVKMTNASEHVLVSAATNLRDVSLYQRLLPELKDPQARRALTVRVAEADLQNPERFEIGAQQIKRLARETPDDADVMRGYLHYAKACQLTDRKEEALAAYRNALEIWPSLAHRADVEEARGWALRAVGLCAEAAEAYERAFELMTTDEDRAAMMLARGETLGEMGKGDDALTCYRRVLADWPKTEAAQRLAQVMKLREKEDQARDDYLHFRFQEAAQIFREIAQEDPKREPRMSFLVVLCLYGENRDDEAIALATKLMKESPDRRIRARATEWLAKLAYNGAKWDEASKLFEQYAKTSKEAALSEAYLWAARAAFADGSYLRALTLISRLVEQNPKAELLAPALLVQGETLMELARYDEALLVFERAIVLSANNPVDRIAAQILRADVLFTLGSDNPVHYQTALTGYRTIYRGESLSAERKLILSYKIARTFEKLNRVDEAFDEYYTNVILGYRQGRLAGIEFSDEARADFVRSAFHLADEYERRHQIETAMRLLELVAASDVPAAEEAEKRLERLQMKGLLK